MVGVLVFVGVGVGVLVGVLVFVGVGVALMDVRVRVGVGVLVFVGVGVGVETVLLVILLATRSLTVNELDILPPSQNKFGLRVVDPYCHTVAKRAPPPIICVPLYNGD